MKKVVVLGHFAFGMNKSNGQTIKTQSIAIELKRSLGDENVDMEDTVGGFRFLLRLPFVLFRLMRNYSNIIILPAYKGVLVIVPVLSLLNLFFHRRIHYVVIGGWLPSYMKKHPLLKFTCKSLTKIYVETNKMKEELAGLCVNNVKMMPNFKRLYILKTSELPASVSPVLKVCTFSRVMKEKGIEDAINAVVRCNRRLGLIRYTLDIYGMVEPGQEQWLENLMRNQPAEICYKGVVDYKQSSVVLKEYFVMLFPTHFPTEGFPGTVIDAFSAGLPTIASDCASIKEILRDGETGFIYPMNSLPALTDILLYLSNNPNVVESMRPKCLQEAQRYVPEKVISILISEMV